MTPSVDCQVFNTAEVVVDVQATGTTYLAGTSGVDPHSIVYRLPADPPSSYESEREAFNQMLPNLGQYSGQFVAIHRGEIAGNDRSQHELAQKFFADHPGAAVYIGFVGPRRVLKIPTPLIRRRRA